METKALLLLGEASVEGSGGGSWSIEMDLNDVNNASIHNVELQRDSK